jgi:outer membrane autotransporter protein
MSRRLVVAIAASAAQMLICIAGVPAHAQGTPFSFASPNTPVPLLDLATTIDTFTVSESGTIADLNVFIDLDHTWMHDLDIFLEHDAISVHLFNRFGGSLNDIQSVLFDDEAAASIDTGTPPYGPGSFQPSPGSLASFDGQDIQGVWSLRIVDNVANDVGTLFIFRIEGTLVAVFVPIVPEGARDPIDFEVGAALTQIAEQAIASDPDGDLALLLGQLGDLDRGEVSDALKQFAHEEVPAQADFSLRNLRTHQGQVRDRLRTLRGPDNGSGIQTASFSPLGEMLEPTETRLAGASFFASAEEGERVALPAISAPHEPAPFGVWLQGEGHFGDKDTTRNEAGFEYDGRSGSIGLDYRLSDDLVIGVAGGTAGSDIDYNGSAGSLDSDAYYASLYGSLRPLERLFLELTGSYAWDDFETKRNILVGTVARRAKGHTGGESWGLDLSSYYELGDGAVSFGPVIGVSYLETRIDGYREGGAGSAGLRVSGQKTNSLQTRLGAEFSYGIETGLGRLAPSLQADWIHEFEDDLRRIDATFVDFPRAPFEVRSDGPDRDYFQVGAGVVANLNCGLDAYLRYETMLGLDDWKTHQITGGFTWTF